MKPTLVYWATALALTALWAISAKAIAQTSITSTDGTSYPYIVGSTGAQANLPLNLSGYSDWVYYIYGGESIVDGAGSNFDPYLQFGNASTSSNSLGYSSAYRYGSLGANGDVPVTYTGGYQYDYASTGNTLVVGAGSGDDAKTNEGLYSGTSNGGSVSLQTITGTITLTAASENFTFYLDENDASPDMSVTLTDANTSTVTSYTATNVMLAGAGDNFSAFNLDITGSSAGSTLIWTESAESTGYNSTYGHVGIVAITEDPVPEPPVYRLMFGGLGLLWIGRRALSLQR